MEQPQRSDLVPNPAVRRLSLYLRQLEAFRKKDRRTISSKQLGESLGLTVFLITHDLDTLYTICDRVAVLSQKRVLIADTLDKVERCDDEWVQEYFQGPRGRAAQRATSRSHDPGVAPAGAPTDARGL